MEGRINHPRPNHVTVKAVEWMRPAVLRPYATGLPGSTSCSRVAPEAVGPGTVREAECLLRGCRVRSWPPDQAGLSKRSRPRELPTCEAGAPGSSATLIVI